jgi:hypothetical protein
MILTIGKSARTPGSGSVTNSWWRVGTIGTRIPPHRGDLTRPRPSGVNHYGRPNGSPVSLDTRNPAIADLESSNGGVSEDARAPRLRPPREPDGHLRRIEIQILGHPQHRKHGCRLKKRVEAMRRLR